MELRNFSAVDYRGNILPGATCNLYQVGTTTPVVGLQNAAGNPLSNPFLADAKGVVQLRAPDGEYDLNVKLGAIESTLRIKFFDDTAFKADLANPSDPAKGAGMVGTLKMAALTSNDFNATSITGFYAGVGDGGGGLASLNAPVGSGNVRLDIIVLRGPASITQMAIAANAANAKVWFRSGFVSGGDYTAALVAAPWRSMPILEGNAVFKDISTAVKSLLYIEHYGDGTNGQPQTYGLDIHNYPGAKTGLVVHQYSNNGPAIWLDNTDNTPGIRINNTHNSVLNPGGPPTALGDFQEWQTEGISNLRLKRDYVFESFQVIPTFLRSDGTALSVQTPIGVSASTMSIARAHNANAGAALSITNSGGTGININQTGPGVALNVTSAVGAAGVFSATFGGYDFGLLASNSQNSGRAMEVRKTGTGAGEALRVRNDGTGQSISVRDAAQNELMSVEANGRLKWTAAANVQATVGAAGGAAALPATPAKYLKIIGDDGVTYVIPAYLAS